MNKILDTLKYDLEIFKTPNLKITSKIVLLIRKYVAVLLNKREIIYLGKKFYYDGRFSPIPLQMYPKEIAFLNKYIDLKKINNILDIGANIGQFSFTLKSFYPNINPCCFEPNKEIFSLLQKNMSYFGNVRLFNYGIGKEGKREFYFSPSSSGLGSFYIENVHQFGHKKDVKKIEIINIGLNDRKLKELKVPNKFDLIKIDVEGAEIEVLESLKGITCEYLFLEVSVNRKGKVDIEETKRTIRRVFNKNPISLCFKQFSKDSPSVDYLFKLENIN